MNVDLDNILKSKISLRENVWSPLSQEITISDALERIKNGKYKNAIEKLRIYLNKGKKNTYDDNKKRLPAVTFCGIFDDSRKTRDVKHYNEIIILDIDKLTTDQLREAKVILEKDKYVFSFWESPSKNGLKALIKIKFNFLYDLSDFEFIHKNAFANIVSYFYDNYKINIDKSGSDISRLCFFSYDRDLFLDDTAVYYEQNFEDMKAYKKQIYFKGKTNNIKKEIKNLLYNPIKRNRANNRFVIASIIKYLTKRNLSITNDYNSWFRVALAIANTFTYDIGEKYFLKLCRLDGSKHDEKGSKNLIFYSYQYNKRVIQFKTVIYFAKLKGYKNNRGGTKGG